MYSLALIIFVVAEKKAFEHFPIGSNVNLCPAMVAILDFRSTLDPMGKMFQNASSLKPLGQLKPNYSGMIIGRSSTKILFFMPIGNPRWQIKISLNCTDGTTLPQYGIYNQRLSRTCIVHLVIKRTNWGRFRGMSPQKNFNNYMQNPAF
jgi:hypothetical protein